MTNNDVMALTAFLPGSQLAGHTIGNTRTQPNYCTVHMEVMSTSKHIIVLLGLYVQNHQLEEGWGEGN